MRMDALKDFLDRADERVAIPAALGVFAALTLGAALVSGFAAGAGRAESVDPVPASQGGYSFTEDEASGLPVAAEPGPDDLALLGEAPADLAADEDLHYRVRTVVPGDTVWDISIEYGVSMDAIFSMNDIPRARALRVGMRLKIPSVNGILRTAKAGDTPLSLAEAFGVSPERIVAANRLESVEVALDAGRSIFLPDASLPRSEMGERTGDLFRWPFGGRITSWYGWRRDPFNGSRVYHGALDIAGPRGSTVRAAMAGTVSQVGFSSVLGNYVTIRHPIGGYSTLYGHLDAATVKVGQYVAVGQGIGKLGNSGYSTGPHVHFAVFKHGVAINPVPLLY